MGPMPNTASEMGQIGVEVVSTEQDTTGSKVHNLCDQDGVQETLVLLSGLGLCLNRSGDALPLMFNSPEEDKVDSSSWVLLSVPCLLLSTGVLQSLSK